MVSTMSQIAVEASYGHGNLTDFPHGEWYRPPRPAYLGDLLTNAKKVTVSVLYWYEKLSSLN